MSPNPFLGYLDHLVTQKTSYKVKILAIFEPFSLTNILDFARRAQFRDVTVQQRNKIFKFCKKFLNPHNLNINIS